MSDSSGIVNALVAKLGADTVLLNYMTNGVYEDMAPEGMTKFVIVSQILAQDVDTFGGRAYEDVFVLIEARATVESRGDVRAAAAEIDALLDPPAATSPGTATLDVTGYTLMGIQREEFVRATERDEQNTSIVWKRRGGRYRIRCAIAAT